MSNPLPRMHKEVREVFNEAVRAGYRFIRYTGTGHYKFENEHGGCLIIPSTPRGSRWKKNSLAEIRRAKTRRSK